MTDVKITEYEEFFRKSNERLDEIKNRGYDKMDESSKLEYNGLKKMFEMLSTVNLKELK